MGEKHHRESVSAGVAYSFAGNVLYAGSQWLISMFIVKAGGAAMLGAYAMAMAIITPLLSISNMNLRVVLVTDASRSFSFREYFGLRLISSVVCLGLASLIFWCLPGVTFASWLLGMSIASYRLAETVPDIVQGIFQRAGKMRLVANSLFLRTVAVILIFSIFSLLLKRVTLSFFALGFASLVITLFYDLRLGRTFENCSPKFEKSLLHLSKLSLPLAVGTLISNIHLGIPRYFLNETGKLEVLGQFAALTNLMVIGSMLAHAVGTTLSPRLAEHFFNKSRGQFIKMATGLLAADGIIALLLWAVTHVLGRDLLRLLYNEEISAAYQALPFFVLALALMLFEAHLGVVLTAMQVFRSQLILQVAKLCVCLVLCGIIYRNDRTIYSAIKALNWSLVSSLAIALGLVIFRLNSLQRPSESGVSRTALDAVSPKAV